jgi:hypothetical protein
MGIVNEDDEKDTMLDFETKRRIRLLVFTVKIL